MQICSSGKAEAAIKKTGSSEEGRTYINKVRERAQTGSRVMNIRETSEG